MTPSCRNCAHSRHDGYFHIRLICRVNGAVVQPFGSTDDNRKHDEQLRVRASDCQHYTPDNQGE